MNSRKTELSRKLVAMALIAAVTVIGFGCTTPKQSVVIPFPRTTPFDYNAMARMTYLEAFRDGYLVARSRSVPGVEVVQRPDYFAYELGFRAGASAGRAPQLSPESND